MVQTPEGETVDESSELLGEATNNVAEYRALLLGLSRALAMGASDVEIIGDSELIARQVSGVYKVKHEAMRALHGQTHEALSQFERWSIRTVPRERNARADALVNAALDSAVATGAARA